MIEGSVTLLLVDDTESNIDILVDILGAEYDLLVALDGISALETAEEEVIDLVLLDIMMPEMDGFEVCEKLKKSQKTKEIPIVFITAKTDAESIDRLYDAGGADYIIKPFREKELKSRVKTQLELVALRSK